MKSKEKLIKCCICQVSYPGKDLPGLVCSKCARECYRTIRDMELEAETMDLLKCGPELEREVKE